MTKGIWEWRPLVRMQLTSIGKHSIHNGTWMFHPKWSSVTLAVVKMVWFAFTADDTDIVHTNFATFIFHYFMQRLTALICCYDKSTGLGCTTISGTFCNWDFQGMVTLQTCLVPRPCQISLASQLHSILQADRFQYRSAFRYWKRSVLQNEMGLARETTVKWGQKQYLWTTYSLLTFTMHEETVASYMLSTGFGTLTTRLLRRD